MKPHRKTMGIAAALGTLMVFACVTINIYFPAEKVKSVAGEIVKDIRGQEEGKGTPAPEQQKDSLLRRTLLAFSGGVAWAEEVTTVSNPTIRALKARMKARFGRMRPYFQKGILREGDDGYVSVGDTGGLGLRERRNVKSLVAAENEDRRSLYAEVARALKIDPGQVDKVATIFAREWQKSVP